MWGWAVKYQVVGGSEKGTKMMSEFTQGLSIQCVTLHLRGVHSIVHSAVAHSLACMDPVGVH